MNKINGLAVQGGSKVKFNIDMALPYLIKGQNNLKLTHRIDKSTSGILLLAKSKEVAREITRLFKNKKISKTYWALTLKSPKKKANIIKVPLSKVLISGKEIMATDFKSNKIAETSYQVLENKNGLTLLEVYPKTGRKHQIRAHLLYINAPILGDQKYCLKQKDLGIINSENRHLHLHSKKISFILENKKYNIEAKLPKHFKSSLAEYKFKVKYE